MKLASYMADGKACFGVVTGDGVITLNHRLGYTTLRDALTGGSLADIRKAADAAKPDRKPADVKWLPAIPNPDKILCAGINYRSHAAETGRELPKQPSMFIRLANTLTGHEGEMIRPSVSQSFDFEGELAVVIGRAGRPLCRSRPRMSSLRRGRLAGLSKLLRASGKEFPRHGSARALDRHHRRDCGSGPPHAHDAAERAGGAEVSHRSPDLFGAADHRVLLGLHAAPAGRRDRHRDAGRGRPSPQSTIVDEAR